MYHWDVKNPEIYYFGVLRKSFPTKPGSENRELSCQMIMAMRLLDAGRLDFTNFRPTEV